MKTRILLSIILICLIGALQAQIIHVPGDQPTIQAGIDAASEGDTVLVAQGNYYENILFKGKEIVVASHYIQDGDSAHIFNTVIDGSEPAHSDSAAVVMFLHGEDTTSVLAGFTITGGTGFFCSESMPLRIGGGIAGYEAGGKIIHNIIIGNEVENDVAACGGGIAFITWDEGFHTIIRGNLISDNFVSDVINAFGGGIYVATNTVIADNVITYNHVFSENGEAEGGAIEWEDLDGDECNLYVLTNNTIKNNKVEGVDVRGAAICCRFGSTVMMNNIISKNDCLSSYRAWGGGVYYQQNTGKIIFKYNEVEENSMSAPQMWTSGAMIIADPLASVEIANNLFVDNGGGGNSFGGAVSLYNGFEIEHVVDANLFEGNDANIGGALYINKTYNLAITNNIFTENDADILGGAIRFFHYLGDGPGEKNVVAIGNSLRKADPDPFRAGGGSHPKIANNTFVGNEAGTSGGAILISYAPNIPVIFNNIFWQNEAYNGFDIQLEDPLGTMYIYHNDVNTDQIVGSWTGEGNFYADPVFMDPELGDFCIDSCASPCIDAGIDSLSIEGIGVCCAPSYDIRGLSRSVNPDLGAYETGICVGYNESEFQISNTNLHVYPNPTRGISDIRYQIGNWQLAIGRWVTLSVYDIHGQEIKVMVNEKQGAGEYNIRFDCPELPAGIYFVRLQAGDQSTSVKLVKSH